MKKIDKRHSAIPVANKCADIIKIICMELLELLGYFVFIFIIMNLLQNLTDPRCGTAVLTHAAVLQKAVYDGVAPRRRSTRRRSLARPRGGLKKIY
jgi:hypothetical protein